MRYRVLAREWIFPPEKHFPQCHASSVERLSDGTLAVAWFAGTKEKADDVAIWLSRRVNGCWTEPAVVADCPGIACWNPVLRSDGAKLVLYYKVGKEIPAWRTVRVVSLDGGVTWSPPEELVPGDIGGRGPVRNHILRLRDGALLAGASLETADRWDCFFDRSEDGGETWTRSGHVPINHARLQGKGIIQPALWQSGDGGVHALLRSTEGRIYRTDSSDGGRSWSAAEPIDLPNNNSGIDVARMEDGTLLLACNPVAGNWAGRTPIALRISRDDGESWRETEVLEHREGAAAGEFSYPSIVCHGREVYITYTWDRRTIAFWQLELLDEREDAPIPDGVWVTMITPYTPDGEVDDAALDAMVDWYIQQGVDGIFAVCQSSEMFFLSEEERLHIAERVLKRVDGRVSVVVSGHVEDSVEAQIPFLQRMAAKGADAVVLVTNRLAEEGESDDVWKANATRILTALPDVRFGLYECPYPYKRLLSPELLRWCADTGRFVFLKDTSCDLEEIVAKLTAIRGTGFQLFNANVATLLPSLRHGARGFCGVMGNFHPALYARLMRMHREGDPNADDLQAFLTVASFIEMQVYPINAKYHMQLCGLPVELVCRSRKADEWNRLKEIETEALYRHAARVGGEGK